MKPFEQLRNQLKELIDEIADTTIHGPTRRLPALISQQDGWIWVSDAQGLYTWCSPEIEKILGVSSKEVLGKPVYRAGFRDDSALHLREHFEDGKDINNLRLEAQTEKGALVTLTFNAQAQLNRDGVCIGFRGATLLLGVEKAKPEKIAVRLPLEPSQVDVTSPPSIAPTWGGMHGFEEDDAGMRPILNPLSELQQTTRADEIRLQVPIRIQEHVLGVLDFEAEADSRAWQESDLALVEAVAEDLALALQDARTFQLSQQALDEMREADRLKTQFLANMSHELRTPLNSIIGFSRVILKGIDGPVTPTQKQDLEEIYNAGQHLLGLINDILDVSKIEAGRMELAFTEVDLGEIIHGVLSTAVGLVKDKPIELITEVPDDLPSVQADKMRLRQILLNLLSNAAKFTNEGQIGITAKVIDRGDREEVVVGVFDTGPGISPEDQEKLFEPFSQVDASSTRRTGGTGLGLSICRHLVELHGGKIWVESVPEEGSTFAFTIPVYRRRAKPSTEKTSILVVSEDARTLDPLQEQIESFGLSTRSVTQPAETLNSAISLQPDAIFVDSRLPHGSCWSVLANLAARQEIQAVSTFLYSYDADRASGFLLDPHAHVLLPLESEALERLLPRVASRDPEDLEVLFVADVSQDLEPLTAAFMALGNRGDRVVFSALAALESLREQPPDLAVIDLTMHDIEGFFTLEGVQHDEAARSVPTLTTSPADPSSEERKELRLGIEFLIHEGSESEEDFFTKLKTLLDNLGLHSS